jgi:hypothetical protein
MPDDVEDPAPNAGGDPGAGAARRPAKPEPPLRTLRHEGRLLPNLRLDPRGPLGSLCRARFDGRSLREVGEYVCDCAADPGPVPDDFSGLFTQQTGTIGAKQSLLAALAAEVGRKDLQLTVACCEMRLPELRTGRPDHFVRRSDSVIRRPATLPLAVVWLRHRGRRLQIVEPLHASLQSVKLVTEVTVEPLQLVAERVRLYESFAADWCRALEVHPVEFARLRAWQLRLRAHTSVFEDLLGHALPSDFMPQL